MKLSNLSSVALLASSALAQNGTSTSSAAPALYTIEANNITAVITPYGARLTSCLVPDRNGDMQNIALGYEDGSRYIQDTATNHTYFGAVVGRYANRIKNGTFTLSDGSTYQIPTNENGGLDTLHGGNVGYDARNWTVVTQNGSSISMTLLDTGFEGFPGTVLTTATYSVSSYASGPKGQLQPRLTTKLVSIALDHETPIMLSNHIYWNLNAFQAATVENDTYIWMPYSDRYIQTDPILIPNGTFGTVADNPALDFTTPQLVGDAISATEGLGYCGNNCTGIDNAFTVDRPTEIGATSVVPVVYMWSELTGIHMTMSNNQIGLQIYTCGGQNGTVPVNEAQVERNQGIEGAVDVVNKFGCVVLEPQVYIDGINNPSWGVNSYEIFSPETGPSVNYAHYDFTTV